MAKKRSSSRENSPERRGSNRRGRDRSPEKSGRDRKR